MVDFKKLLREKPKIKETDPLEIFRRLDKKSGKEYLRPHQEKILSQWNENFLSRKDTLIKLHTGQGKTLVGLLTLQASINAGVGPAIYLCPNKYLVRQTTEEAKSFGIPFVEFSESGSSPPIEFLHSEAILITTCSKLFNGKSVFGVVGSDREPIRLGSIVIDDAHKCLDIIRDSFSIEIFKKQQDHTHPVYQKLWDLFEPALMRQSAGTCIDIKENYDAHMMVPFWIWNNSIGDVLKILQKYKNDGNLRFVWNLVKNKLDYSTCIFSGKKLEISPRLIPIDMIPSFFNAQRRIFLSATLTEDAFLVRDLGMDAASVNEPLALEDVKFSGERMILIPTLLNPYLDRNEIIEWASRYSEKHGEFGVVSLVPSGYHAEDWKSEGGIITNVRNLEKTITDLKDSIKNETARHVTVLVNAYDGVDLPDSTCRILCLDSMPAYASLHDRYAQDVRPNSYVIRRQIAQRIEQGIGRGIRGPSDWCVVIATGNKLTSFLSETAKTEFLSSETKEQIGIARTLAEAMNREEGHSLKIIEELVDQCINRNEDWKEFYHEKMEGITKNHNNENFLSIATLERRAELFFQNRQYPKAVDTVQKIVEMVNEDSEWYFQLMATYLYPIDKTDSMDRQVKAFTMNNRLSRPEEGITYSKLTNASVSRENSIIEWVSHQKSKTDLILNVSAILDDVSFGVPADSFEHGIEQLGKILGFASHRPEKVSGRGPDNLWNIEGKQYWLISCKNMVINDFISKTEVGQLSSDIGWFSKEYSGCVAKPLLIHPSFTLNSDAFLDTQSYVITPQKLNILKQNVTTFYRSLANIPQDELSTNIVTQNLAKTHLDIFNINKDYFEHVQRMKNSH